MLAPWVVEEMKDVNFNDTRLNARMGLILDRLGGHPGLSIPAACVSWPETLAAYRFFDNGKVLFESVLEPHIEATYRRVAEQPVAILVQDTTELDLTRPNEQVEGAGPLDNGNRRGALLHPLMAFTPDGTPLGTVCAEVWVRDDPPEKPLTKQQKEFRRKHTPIEQKESFRWLETLTQAQQVADQAPTTHCICVADSECDIYEFVEQAQQGTVDWIVRSAQDRALLEAEDGDATASESANSLRGRVMETGCLFKNTIHVAARTAKIAGDTRSRRQSRASREAELEIRAARVELRPPWRSDRKLEPVSVNVVLVTEVDAPEGSVPVEWLLLTSLPINELDLVQNVIRSYTVRWMIEVYFRTLKSSCRVEERQFEHIDRALNAVAVYMIVAWRALMVCRISREDPDASCEVIFEPDEWQSVYYMVHQEPPPETPPPIDSKS